jgi:hypothetical protein
MEKPDKCRATNCFSRRPYYLMLRLMLRLMMCPARPRHFLQRRL